MKLLNNECISSVALPSFSSLHHSPDDLVDVTAEPEAKPPSDDEGVFDLDLDISPETSDSLNITTTITAFGLNRVRAYPGKGRFSLHRVAAAAKVEPKEQLVNLAQAKLKTIDEAVRSPDGLRNKVLLESALKRYMASHGSVSPKKDAMTSFVVTKPPVVSAQLSHQLSPTNLKRSDLIPILCHNRSTVNLPTSNSASCPSSPRKRSVSETSGASDTLDFSLAIKRLKAYNSEDMDISDCSGSCSATGISDLASVFYRLKTQH